MVDPVLSLEQIRLSYGNNLVLDDISLALAAGETAALVGENGAGKSSLARIIAGAHRPDSGTIRVAGTSVSLNSPRSALDNGIAFIPQELIYTSELSVAENILLGRLPARAGFTRHGAILKQARAIADEMEFDLPLDRPMGELTVMQQQLVEVLKAFARRPKVLVLDEPTAALEASDSAQLLSMMDTIAARGVGVLYISHRLDEVYQSCRTIHVLRGGKLVLSAPTAEVQPNVVIEAMLDRALDETLVPKSSFVERREVLRIEGWTRTAFPQLDGIDLELYSGEIVGLYGIRGAGAETIAEGIMGLAPGIHGSMRLRGEPTEIPRSPAAAKRLGISYVPADRKSQGLVLSQSIRDNIALPALATVSSAGFMNSAKEAAWASLVLTETQVKYRSTRQAVGELSGGNQQKILLGSRTLDRMHDLVVVQEPTRGVDIGSRREIHRHLRSLADGGVTLLVVSSDIDELVNLSDRLIVIRNGKVVRELQSPSPDQASVAISSAGGFIAHD